MTALPDAIREAEEALKEYDACHGPEGVRVKLFSDHCVDALRPLLLAAREVGEERDRLRETLEMIEAAPRDPAWKESGGWEMASLFVTAARRTLASLAPAPAPAEEKKEGERC